MSPSSSGISAAPNTTTTNNVYPARAGQANEAYYDTPADKRLRPWILLGSLFLLCLGISQLIVPWTSHGTGRSLWAIFITGVLFTLCSFLGIIAAITLKPSFAKMFFYALAASWVISTIVLIINAALLNHRMNDLCSNNNDPRVSSGCEDIRKYHVVSYSVLAPLDFFWTIPLIVAAGYFARTTDLYRKQEYAATNGQAVPTGSSRM